MISDIAYIAGLTALAGLCIPLGGLLARVERIGPNWLEQEFRHFLIALGGGILLVASGGILYLIFQDIAPQSRLEKHWGPPLGAVLGFCLALLSDMLVTQL